MAFEAGRELATVDKEANAGVVTQDRERQRQRGVGHVAAADVEEPGDRFGHRQYRRRDPVLGEATGEPLALRLRAFAGKAVGMRHDRRQGCGRLVRPDPIQRVAIDRAKAGAGFFGGGGKALDLVRRVQPRVVAEHGAGFEGGADPPRWRLVDQMVDFEQIAVGLLCGLQRIAAVDEECGALAQHDRKPGRAGKPGKPSEALAARRHIFALMLVRARHDKAVETARGELAAQPRCAVGARQPGEILARQAVAIAGSHLYAQLFERFFEGRRHRIGDQIVPARPDLGRRA